MGRNMKKYLLVVIILLGGMIAVVAITISGNYNKVQFSKDLQYHMTTISEGGSLTATYQNTTTNVVGRNLQRINSVIGVSAAERTYNRPDYDENDAVTLSFSHGAEYIIIPNPSVSDGVFIFYSYKNKNQVYKVSGYDSMTWVKKAISPSGIYNPNEVME